MEAKDMKMFWHPQGDFLAIKVEKWVSPPDGWGCHATCAAPRPGLHPACPTPPGPAARMQLPSGQACLAQA
jgi:hypothetical protein